MRKLIASTAIALIIGGPAVAQATQDTATQPGQTQAGQEPAQQQMTTEAQPGQDQQMTAGQGFYQPQPNDLFISEVMEAQVYAPAQRDAAMQPGETQQQGATTTAADPQQQEQLAQQQEQTAEQQEQAAEQQEQAATDPQAEQQAEQQEELAEQQQETAEQEQELAQDQQETQPPAGQAPQGQVATGTTADPQMQQQQAEMQQDQQQLTGVQQQRGFRERQVAQDELQGMENIGAVSDIVIDEQGEIQGVVLDVGGFLGIGAREVALSMDQIEFGRDQDDPDSVVLISQIGANELENAPEFDREQLRQERQWQQTEAQPAATEPATTQDQAAAQPGAQQQEWRGDRQALVAPQMEREGFAQAEAAEVTADNLLGANVYDANDENIGSVSDVVMGPDGQAQYAVIDVGGFLGFGTHTVAIGFDEMQILHDEGWADLRVYVDVTQEQLEQMPEYEQN